jgi:hypothetical protein
VSSDSLPLAQRLLKLGLGPASANASASASASADAAGAGATAAARRGHEPLMQLALDMLYRLGRTDLLVRALLQADKLLPAMRLAVTHRAAVTPRGFPPSEFWAATVRAARAAAAGSASVYKCKRAEAAATPFYALHAFLLKVRGGGV